MATLPASDLSYGTDMTEEYRIKRVGFGDGYSQRAEDGLNTVRQQWRLNWDRIPDALAEELRVFFRDLKGTGIIEWTPYNQPDELKWTANNFQSKPVAAMISSCSIVLTQEFDL